MDSLSCRLPNCGRSALLRCTILSYFTDRHTVYALLYLEVPFVEKAKQAKVTGLKAETPFLKTILGKMHHYYYQVYYCRCQAASTCTLATLPYFTLRTLPYVATHPPHKGTSTEYCYQYQGLPSAHCKFTRLSKPLLSSYLQPSSTIF